MTGFKHDRVTREFEDEQDNEEEGNEDEQDNDDHGEQTEEGEEQTVVGQDQDGLEGVTHDAYKAYEGVEMNEAPVEQQQAAQAPQANNRAKKNDNESLRGEIKALDNHFQSRLNCLDREQKDMFAIIIDGIRAIQATVGIPVVDPHTARPQ